MSYPSEPAFPNRFGRLYLEAVAEVLGAMGRSALLGLGGLPLLMSDLPPDNLAKEFTLREYAAINIAFLKMGGRKMGRGIAVRCGRDSFGHLLRNTDFIALERSDSLDTEKLTALLKPFTLFSEGDVQDVLTIQEDDTHYTVTFLTCPCCWGLSSEHVVDRLGKVVDEPVCFGILGYLAEGVRWIVGHELPVTEVACRIQNDSEVCVFRIDKSDS